MVDRLWTYYENEKKYPKKIISIPITEIWAPKLDIFHFSGSSKSLDFSNEMAKISYTGEVTVTFSAIVHGYCQIIGKYYPMDKHPCFVIFQYKAKNSQALRDSGTRINFSDYFTN